MQKTTSNIKLTKRRGPFSKEEKDFILSGASTLRPSDIAEKLNRGTKQVLDFINNINPLTVKEHEPETRTRILDNFKTSSCYQQLKGEFTSEELSFVQEQYLNLSMQFKEDILASEQQQILKAIKYEVLMSRNLKNRKECVENAQNFKKELKQLDKEAHGSRRNMSDEIKNLCSTLESNIMICEANESQFTNEYVKFETQHQKLMSGLKATREQRIGNIESTKRDWLALIRSLTTKEVLEQEKKQAELIKRAIDNETHRLSKFYDFDGELTKPLLIPEIKENKND